VRHRATDFVDSASTSPTIEGKWPPDRSLQLDTQHDESRPEDQREPFIGGVLHWARRLQEYMLFTFLAAHAPPGPRFVCDGRCKYSEVPRPTVVSIGRSF